MRRAAFVLCLTALLSGQTPRQPEVPDPRLPNGRSQKEEILKADHEKSLSDADELMKLSEELKIDLEKNDRHVLSVATLKKLDEMEKLVKRIRGRMKRF
jgi:hypothetical protein